MFLVFTRSAAKRLAVGAATLATGFGLLLSIAPAASATTAHASWGPWNDWSYQGPVAAGMPFRHHHCVPLFEQAAGPVAPVVEYAPEAALTEPVLQPAVRPLAAHSARMHGRRLHSRHHGRRHHGRRHYLTQRHAARYQAAAFYHTARYPLAATAWRGFPVTRTAAQLATIRPVDVRHSAWRHGARHHRRHLHHHPHHWLHRG
jgi:hypothetical protein